MSFLLPNYPLIFLFHDFIVVAGTEVLGTPFIGAIPM